MDASLIDADADVVEIADRISLAGLEVEAMDEKGKNLSGVVIAEVRAKSPHPKKDKLTLVTVFDGCPSREAEFCSPDRGRFFRTGWRSRLARSAGSSPTG